MSLLCHWFASDDSREYEDDIWNVRAGDVLK